MHNPSQVSNDDNTFECHVKLADVKSAAFAVKESSNRTMHIIRLRNAQSQPILSAILHPEEPGGEVEPGAIQFWENLREKFGDEVELTQGDIDAE